MCSVSLADFQPSRHTHTHARTQRWREERARRGARLCVVYSIYSARRVVKHPVCVMKKWKKFGKKNTAPTGGGGGLVCLCDREEREREGGRRWELVFLPPSTLTRAHTHTRGSGRKIVSVCVCVCVGGSQVVVPWHPPYRNKRWGLPFCF